MTSKTRKWRDIRYISGYRRVYVGKRTWAKVLELSLAQGTPAELFMGRLLKEALEHKVSHEITAEAARHD